MKNDYSYSTFLKKLNDPFEFYYLVPKDQVLSIAKGDEFSDKIYHYFLKKYTKLIYFDSNLKDLVDYKFSKDSIILSKLVIDYKKLDDEKERLDKSNKIDQLTKRLKDETPIFIYNEAGRTSKIKTYQQLDSVLPGAFPKTVFSVKDAKAKLKFPIVGKPNNGHSGIGIVKFDTPEDLEKFVNDPKNSEFKFDLYSECVDFDREFRFIFFEDILFSVSERIKKRDGTGRDINDKKVDEEVEFSYVQQDYNILPFLGTVKKLAKKANETLECTTFSIDCFLTKTGEIKIIEFNAGTGLDAYEFICNYEAIMQYYNKPIDFFDQREIQQLKNTYLWRYNQRFNKEIKNSMCPLPHKIYDIDLFSDLIDHPEKYEFTDKDYVLNLKNKK